MTAHHRHPLDRLRADPPEWFEPYTSIIATLRQAQIADGRRDYEGQIEAVASAIEQLDRLQTSLEIAVNDAEATAFDSNYDKTEAAE